MRENFLYGIIGANGVGKTTLAINLAKQWRAERPAGHVRAFDPGGYFAKVSDSFIQPGNTAWATEACSLRNSLLILDDYRAINPLNTPSEDFPVLMHRRRSWNDDIMYICHSPALVINLLTYYTTHYYIFYTQSTEGSFERKMSSYQICYAASRIVNAYVKEQGKGVYPKFPYAVVNTMTQSLSFVNMDPSIVKRILKN